MSENVGVNEAILQVGQHDLPFRGVGASGMGHYRGYEGFLTFSKLRPVFQQGNLIDPGRPAAAVRHARKAGPRLDVPAQRLTVWT